MFNQLPGPRPSRQLGYEHVLLPTSTASSGRGRVNSSHPKRYTGWNPLGKYKTPPNGIGLMSYFIHQIKMEILGVLENGTYPFFGSNPRAPKMRNLVTRMTWNISRLVKDPNQIPLVATTAWWVGGRSKILHLFEVHPLSSWRKKGLAGNSGF